MPRGEFHLFACRSGEAYAKKIVQQLVFLLDQRKQELLKKKSPTLYEQRELAFLRNTREKGASLGRVRIIHFNDDEMNVQLEEDENVRDRDVFLIQCPYNTASGLTLSQNLFETFNFLDALRHAKARSITLVSLYFPYARGDKQHGKDGVPASLMANLLTTAGMDAIMTLDLHADQITGFFDPVKVRVEHLHASPLFIHYFKDTLHPDAKVVAPDTGAAKRTQFYAQNLKREMVLAYKKRSYRVKHEVDDLQILGDPGDGSVLIIDDIVSSGGSVIKVMDELAKEGVKKAFVACTHPLLIGNAIEKLDALYNDPKHPFTKLVATDVIPHNGNIKSKPWYVEIDTSRFIAKAIYEVHTSGSLTKLHQPFCVGKHDLWVGTDKG